jgi:hypothetical protein
MISLHVVSGPWTSIVAALDKGRFNIAVCRRYSHSLHSSTSRELCRIGLTEEEQDIVLIVEVTLLILVLLGLIEEDGDWPSRNFILIRDVTLLIVVILGRLCKIGLTEEERHANNEISS